MSETCTVVTLALGSLVVDGIVASSSPNTPLCVGINVYGRRFRAGPGEEECFKGPI